jgi:hypothetical protein
MDNSYTNYLNGFYRQLTFGKPVKRSSQNSASDETKTDLTAWRALNGRPGYYIMTGVQSEDYPHGMWPMLQGDYLSMFRIGGTSTRSIYAAPARLNGRDCDIVILISAHSPEGKILGARQDDGMVIQKGCDALRDGDELRFYYKVRNFATQNESWELGSPVTINGELRLGWGALSRDMFVSEQVTDVFGNEYYQELESLQ